MAEFRATSICLFYFNKRLVFKELEVDFNSDGLLMGLCHLRKLLDEICQPVIPPKVTSPREMQRDHEPTYLNRCHKAEASDLHQPPSA